MKWITRRNVKVDRVACPWLIRRFVDPEAEFLFVNEDELLQAAHAEQAIPFDAPRIPEVKLNHRGVRCSFEAIVADYDLKIPALARLALIVRAAGRQRTRVGCGGGTGPSRHRGRIRGNAVE